MHQTSKLNRLIASANAVIDTKGTIRTNGKPASLRTVKLTREALNSTCRRLHKMGFYLEDIQGLSAKHIDALVKNWYADKLNPKTMQNLLSRLRVFSGWINKRGIVREGGVPAFLPDVPPSELKVKTYTENSKSWTGRAVDTLKVIDNAFFEDKRLYAMLLLSVMFGLRRKEVLHIKPHEADRGDGIHIDSHIAKGGRYRFIPIFATDEDPNVKAMGMIQLKVLELAKKLCRPGEHLGWPGKTYVQNNGKYGRLMSKLEITKHELGIVGHGLRAEFSENALLLQGIVPPVLGGTGKEVGTAERKRIVRNVASVMGHNDTHTSGAYFGSFHNPLVVKAVGSFVAVNAEDIASERVGKLCSYKVRLK
jgi:integrase